MDLTRIGDFVDHFLVHRASKPKANYRRLKQLAQQLEYAVAFFGADTKLRHIDTLKVEEYLTHLEKKPRWNREPEPGDEPEAITAPTQRKYLHALSRLIQRARVLKLVASAHDPIRDLEDKPSGRRSTEADWLEHDEAALLLYAASLYEPKRSDSVQCAVPLVATLLLTGARLEEVLGLRIEDLNLERHTIRIRFWEDRRLKTEGAARTVDMPPRR